MTRTGADTQVLPCDGSVRADLRVGRNRTVDVEHAESAERRNVSASSALYVVVVTVAIVVLLPRVAAATGSHNMIRAALVYGPQTPRTGDIWHVSATLESSDGLVHPGRRVKLMADMTVHQMRPVEAEMTRLDPGGRSFSGQLAFTMPGPWRVILQSEDTNELLVGVFPFEVGNGEEPRGAVEMRTVVYLMPPPQPNLLPPWWVLIGTVVLILGFEIVAAVYQQRRLTAAALERIESI